MENISLEVLPGQIITLVGHSGSGKTTISQMVLEFYQPVEGKVLIDNYDVSSLSLQSLRSQVCAVDRNTFLFGSTIRENIALGRENADLSDIVKAAKQAGAHEFIQELPMGYETQIGEGGGMLSGEQRQRIAIAKSFDSKTEALATTETEDASSTGISEERWSGSTQELLNTFASDTIYTTQLPPGHG